MGCEVGFIARKYLERLQGRRAAWKCWLYLRLVCVTPLTNANMLQVRGAAGKVHKLGEIVVDKK